MSFPNDAFRRTGRTTRQIQDANRLAFEGNEVVFIGHSMDFLSAVKGQLSKEVGIGSTRDIGKWNWETFSIDGYSKDTKFVVDHYAFESEFVRRGEVIQRHITLLREKDIVIKELRAKLDQIKNISSY